MNASEQEHSSFIHGIKIASPCPANWDEMTGDERARFCHSCKLNVYNILAMTAAEAEALIEEKEGNLCVRLYRRKDGTVITRDCPRGIELIRRKRLAGAAALVAAVSGVVVYFLNQMPGSTGNTLTLLEQQTPSCEVGSDTSGSTNDGYSHTMGKVRESAPMVHEVKGRLQAYHKRK